MEIVQIKINATLRQLACNRVEELGYTSNCHTSTSDSEYIVLYPAEGLFNILDVNFHYPSRTLEELFFTNNLEVPNSVQVKLNEEYTAVVNKNDIQVGCQTFPISILKDLQKALEKIK